MKSINQWWKVRLFWLAMGLIALILFLLAGCNPVKRTANAIHKNEKLKGELAILCADQFPNVPKISYLPGSVDTTALIRWMQNNTNIWGNNTPEPTTDTVIRKDTVIITRTVTVPVKPNMDSLIRAVRRFIKPDTVYSTTGDSALVVALNYALKNAHDSIAPTLKENAELKTKLAIAQGKANTRLAILIGILIAVLGAGGVWAYLKLKPGIKV